MKRNSLTILVGILLLVIFGLLLFTFQVRQTEIALVTTFDKPSRYITEPGFNLMWPPPIQRVYKFDKRVQTLDYDKIEETLTSDSYNLVVQVYLGWTISKPDVFFSSFPSGKASAAEPALEDLIRSAKSQVVGTNRFSNFVSADPKELKFTEIEKQMLELIQPLALKSYGVDVKFLGIKKLGLPESVTEKVFDRMKQERVAQQQDLAAQGQRDATQIRTDSEVKRSDILSKANSEAFEIKGQAEAEAAKYYSVFNQAPELANFFFELRALEEISKSRTTFFLDQRTSPFHLLATNFWDRPTGSFSPSLSTNNVLSLMDGKGGRTSNSP